VNATRQSLGELAGLSQDFVQFDLETSMACRRIAAILFAIVTAFVVVFQLALALGAPWGAYAMGGAFPGRLPPVVRFSALVQGVVLCAFAAVVLARAGAAFPRFAQVSRWLIWVVVAFSGVSLILNCITPSTGERFFWAPVAFVLSTASLLVATGGNHGH
jgi:hypothetical protein